LFLKEYFNHIVVYLLKARTVEPEKQPLPGNARKQQLWNCHETDVTGTAIAMEELSKHVSAETNTRNNRGVVFSVLLSVPRGFKKDKEDSLSQLSFETPTCQDRSFGERS
jgi:hypothetical protein